MAVEKHEVWEGDLAFLDPDTVTKKIPSFALGLAAPAHFLCFLGRAHTNLGIPTNCTYS